MDYDMADDNAPIQNPFLSELSKAIQRNDYACFEQMMNIRSDDGGGASFPGALMTFDGNAGFDILDQAIAGHCHSILRIVLRFPPNISETQCFSLLQKACQTENWTAIHLLVEQGAVNIDSRNVAETGDTLLLQLCRLQPCPLAAIRILLQMGANTNALDRMGESSLLVAAKTSRHPALIQELLSFGANVNYSNLNNGGATALHIVTQQHYFGLQTTILRLLLKAGADINATDRDGQTALFYAADQLVSDHETDTCLFCLLLEYGANPNVHGNSLSPLHKACDQGSVAAVEALVRAGANVHVRDAQHGRTPLHYANLSRRQRKHEKIRILIEQGGADPNVRSGRWQRSILHEYVFRPAVAYDVDKLVQLGCDVHARDANGWTPLHYAAMSGQYALVLQFLRAGASPHVVDNQGRTPLHLFSGLCPNLQGLYASDVDAGLHAWVMERGESTAFLEHCDEINRSLARDFNRTTEDALMLWHRLGNAWSDSKREASDCLSLLLDKGANVRSVDHSKNLPLFMVCATGRRTCIYLMLQSAAYQGLFCESPNSTIV